MLETARRSHHENDPEHPIKEEAFNRVEQVLARSDITYEQMVSDLLAPRWEGGPPDQDLVPVARWIMWGAETVLRLLTLAHSRTQATIPHHYQRLADLAQGGRLHIYSLNHDLLVEEVAHRSGIPLDDGLGSDTFSVWNRARTAKLDLVQRSRVHGRVPLSYVDAGPGIRLVKLHGSLDLYGQGDYDNYDTASFVKLRAKPGAASFIDEYRWLIEEGQYYFEDGIPFTSFLEHVVNGESGDAEFLRSSLLTGGDKFDRNHPGYAMPEALDMMREKIGEHQRIVAIGYSFGDKHINAILEEWLAEDAGRSVIAVGPSFTSTDDLPEELRSRSEIWATKATGALLSLTSSEDATGKDSTSLEVAA
jgi:hypothetical protein